MKVFCDFHHGGLYFAMHLLWEKRLGAELYTMRGKEWHTNGFWKIYDNPATVAQYLEYPEIAMGDMRKFREGKNQYEVKMVTFEEFKKMKFDYIIASIYNHEQPFVELRNKYQPGAKLVRHMGNFQESSHWTIKNLLNSTNLKPPQGINSVTWRQEFDLEDYKYTPPSGKPIISTFLHNMKAWPYYSSWLQLQSMLPGIQWREYGIINKDGCCKEEEISTRMQESAFVYHVKFPPDGYGHNIHHAFACGRPLITRVKDYAKEIAGPLFIPDETVIDFDSVENLAKKIPEFLEPAKHKKMCENVFKRFKEVVNFDDEEKNVRKWLENAR